jgi:sensitive to high expression protein 9
MPRDIHLCILNFIQQILDLQISTLLRWLSMRRVLQHVSRSFSQETGPIPRQSFGLRLKLQSTSTASFVCFQCRLRTSPTREDRSFQGFNTKEIFQQSRSFSSYHRLRKEEKLDELSSTASISEPPKRPPSTQVVGDKYPPKSALNGSSVNVVPDEDLPSYQERMRWTLSKRFNRMMDDLMPKLALASQRINNYTGTDYSGIEALRKEIIAQGTAFTY